MAEITAAIKNLKSDKGPKYLLLPLLEEIWIEELLLEDKVV